MEYKTLGRSGLRISSLCMGTMTFGSGADVPECEGMYAMCRDAGINTFDCADIYAKGRSEEILGRLVQKHRHEVVLTTKVYFPMGPSPNDQGLGRKHLRLAIDKSLVRLGTDYVDILYLHKFDTRTPMAETLEATDLLVRQGKVLYVGLSNFAAWQTELAIREAQANGLTGITCIQPMYSLLKRQCESEILPMAHHEGLGVFAYSPLAAGYLSGKYVREGQGDGRIAEMDMYRRRYAGDGNLAIARLFLEYARAHGLNPVTLAIAWVASHPAISAPLIGARTCAQLAPALEAASLVLSSSMRDEISALSAAPAIATDRSEEAQ